MLLDRTKDIEEQARIDKRKADRQEKANLRYMGYEGIERERMGSEDKRSFQLRFYAWECYQEYCEREALFHEELEQCSVDRFWGLDLEASKDSAEKDKLMAYYQWRVNDLRRMLIMTKQVRPFQMEAQYKVYRDPRTGKALT